MSNIISLSLLNEYISCNCWEEFCSGDYLVLSNNYAIRMTEVKGEVWFEVDQEPLLDGCYLFSSNNLKETLDWCYDNLNIDLMYY